MAAKGTGSNKASPAKSSSVKKSFTRADQGRESEKAKATGISRQQLRSVQKLDAVLAKKGVSKAEVKSASGAMQFNAQAPDKLGRGSTVLPKRPVQEKPYVNKEGVVYKSNKAKQAAENLDNLTKQAKPKKVHITRHHAPAPKPLGAPANSRSGVSVRVKKPLPEIQKTVSLQQERSLAILSAARNHQKSLDQGRSKSQGRGM